MQGKLSKCDPRILERVTRRGMTALSFIRGRFDGEQTWERRERVNQKFGLGHDEFEILC